MNLKVILIDDEPDAIDVIESIIVDKKEDYKIVAKTTNPIEGIGLILKHKPDVVFLDIEMPEMNGFQLLESIPNIDFEVIFATAYENYAIKAIKENALDYILKPATIPEVLSALEKAKSKRQQEKVDLSKYTEFLDDIKTNRFQRIKIPTSNGFELIESDDLIFIDADGAYTTAHFKDNEELIISKPIKQIESLLNSENFFRIHRSYIVNKNHIKRFARDKYALIMIDDSVIPISRRRYDAFMDFIDK